MQLLLLALEREWQYIPAHLEPVAFEIGGVPVYWYALFFLLGSGLVYWLARASYVRGGIVTKKEYTDFSFGVFVSAIIGGKLGFLFLYWWPFISLEQNFVPRVMGSGLSLPGMSFVGGLIGVTLFFRWYAKRHDKSFFVLTDTVALWIPLAFFFGRLGSFFNLELKGRITELPWGMYFPGETVLRHPSTLYAAFLEGCVLFSILFVYTFFFLKNKKVVPGFITAWFCIGYGILRFLSEFFREPDAHIGYIGVLTLNQWMAMSIFVLGVSIFTVQKRKNTL